MAEKIAGADGTITVIDEHYGFGSMAAGPATRAEDPARYTPRTLTESEVLRRYDAKTLAELRAWQVEFGFPAELTQPAETYWTTNLRQKFRPTKRWWLE